MKAARAVTLLQPPTLAGMVAMFPSSVTVLAVRLGPEPWPTRRRRRNAAPDGSRGTSRCRSTEIRTPSAPGELFYQLTAVLRRSAPAIVSIQPLVPTWRSTTSMSIIGSVVASSVTLVLRLAATTVM